MRKPLFRIVFIFIIVILLNTSTGLLFSQSDPLEGLDDYILKAMKDWEVPGLAVAIVKDDKIVLAKGYGLKEIGKNDPVNENTLFAIGSNTKAFTATALAFLVQDKKLSWDDRVIDHLKGFQLYDPYVTREITVRDLLCHRSGLGRRGDALWYGQDFSREEIIRRVRFLKPNSSFRSQFGYQNIMFLTAGQLIPAITGKSWDDFIKERIFKPLAMNRSNTSPKDLVGVDNVATPHTKKNGQGIAIPYRNIDNIAPAGSINSSVAEMTHWHRFLLGKGKYEGKQVLDSSILQETFNPNIVMTAGPERQKMYPSNHFQAYGMGWVLEDYRGRLIIWHNGGIDGMLSQQGILPEENLGIVVLTNNDRNRLDAALFYRIVDAFLGDPVKDWSAAIMEQVKEGQIRAEKMRKEIEESRILNTKPSLEAVGYCGRYEHEMYGTAEVKLEDGKLILYYNSKPMGVLDHWHYDTFRVNPKPFGTHHFNEILEEAFVTITLNARGKVDEIDIEGLAEFEPVPEVK
ncbi:MAG: serine hydrolase [Candidatus Aminicenantes bacterium]|nr:serine hydrolase [Candidatus Aminicenantes bacterium]